MKKERRMPFRRDLRAVSPVIGVLLMVAVTVIMAAIIMSWSSSVSAPETPKSCGVSVGRVNSTLIRVTVTDIQPSSETITNITCNDVKILPPTNKTVNVGSRNGSVALNSSEYAVMVCNWADGTRDVIYDAKP